MRLLKKRTALAIGQAAETFALSYLQDLGLRLVTKNYRSRFGEIDLIVQDGQTLVFIEVRCRHKNALVAASESVDATKIKKIIKTAEYYLSRQDACVECRFDVVAITHDGTKSGYTIDWMPAAFSL